MGLFYCSEISHDSKLAIWKIEEDESFFTQSATQQYPISHPQKRLQHLAGRFLLPYLFAGFPLQSIQVSPTGKPYLKDNSYHFSISHSGNFAAAIVSKSNRVGIDIEHKRNTVAKVASRFLHQEEINQLQSLSITQIKGNSLDNSNELNDLFASNIEQLTLLWSAKEAIYKWWGLGNLEFNEMIRIDNWQKTNEGIMKARIVMEESIFDLVPNYRFFDDLCLVWLS